MQAVKIATTAAFATIALASAAFAQGKGVERLHILECGQGHTGDMSRWTPGQNVNVPKDIVDNCYLIKHAQGYFLWDTGVADSTPTDTPNSADPKALTWRRPKTLAAQLTELGVKADDIKYVAVSHTHPDHIGNVEEFPKAMLLVQKAEYEWRCGALPVELGGPHRSRLQLRSGEVRDVDDAHGRHPCQRARRDLDQPRQAAARAAQARACFLRITRSA